MLHESFYWIMNMTIIASVVGILLYFLRYIKGIPKQAVYALWLIVLFRMLCPVGIPSKLSLMNLLSRVAERTVVKSVPMNNPEFTLSNTLQSAKTYEPITYKSIGLEQIFQVAGAIWIIVALVTIFVTLILYHLNKAGIKHAVMLEPQIYESNLVTTPTVYGLIKPKIILPLGVDQEQLQYILAHERVHIQRKDNLWRMVVLIAACIHWFNPLSWLFVKIFLADCELACDEAAVRKLSSHERSNYARALLTYAAADHTFINSTFGGSKVKQRIVNILSFRQLTWFSALFFLVLVLSIALMLLTNAAV